MSSIESKRRRARRARGVESVRFVALVCAMAGCAGESAKIVSASDVASCKPLGEVTADVAPQAGPDDRAAALQSAATEKGATDVVSEGDATSNRVQGQAYDCGYDRNGKAPSRSEQRSGF